MVSLKQHTIAATHSYSMAFNGQTKQRQAIRKKMGKLQPSTKAFLTRRAKALMADGNINNSLLPLSPVELLLRYISVDFPYEEMQGLYGELYKLDSLGVAHDSAVNLVHCAMAGHVSDLACYPDSAILSCAPEGRGSFQADFDDVVLYRVLGATRSINVLIVLDEYLLGELEYKGVEWSVQEHRTLAASRRGRVLRECEWIVTSNDYKLVELSDYGAWE